MIWTVIIIHGEDIYLEKKKKNRGAILGPAGVQLSAHPTLIFIPALGAHGEKDQRLQWFAFCRPIRVIIVSEDRASDNRQLLAKSHYRPKYWLLF